jgi:prevent-host-death family protein
VVGWPFRRPAQRTMKQIGDLEAKNELGALLDLVEHGEEVLITRRGKAVAKLVPARSKADVEEALAAGRRIRERAKKLGLGPFDWEEWKAYRDEGRR